MAKDYAKRVFTTGRRPKKKSGRRQIIIAFIILFILFIGSILILHNQTFLLDKESWFSHIKALVQKSHSPSSTSLNKQQTVVHSPPMVHFDFYNELPQRQIGSMQPEPAVPAQINSALKQTLAYVVQFGLFQDALGASQLRLSLLLSGIEADIVKIHTASGELFQVQKGPFGSQIEAKKYQRQFQKQGVSSVIKKV